MVSLEPSSHFQSSSSSMVKSKNRGSWCLTDGFLYLGGAFLGLFLVWCFWSFFILGLDFEQAIGGSKPWADSGLGVNLGYNPKATTFYDDLEISYSIEKLVKGWDEKQKQWLKHHPSFATGTQERIVLVTKSQAKPCKNPIGNHLLLRFFKNKVDYCRIHGYDIFYNNLLLHSKMNSYWAKLPVVKAALLAHPAMIL